MSKPRETAPVRCTWAAGNDAEYQRYHDEEWGVPLKTDRAIFEKLALEGFQAGLSWITILRKRENFRRAFDKFDAERIARYGAKDIARLMADAGIVRNRAKVEATIDNAKTYLKLRERTTLKKFMQDFLGEDGPVQNRAGTMSDIPAETELSKRISKALKAEGFRFVGPTTVYAFMQSAGMVNDHLVGCFRHAECAKLQRASVKS
jgi:DNA-3-methyladenine glycosylase I